MPSGNSNRGAALRASCIALLSVLHPPSVNAAESRSSPWWHDAPAVPERFAVGLMSTEAEESALNLTPDGHRVYFARSRVRFPASRIAAIYQVDRSGSGWGEPTPAAFSRGFRDVDPVISADGGTVLFSSMRPVDGRPRKDFDLWSVHVGADVNSDADDLYPSLTRDGTLYFGSDRDGGAGGWDLYASRQEPDGSYGPAEPLGCPINTAAWKYNPAIASDGRFIVFTSLNRAGGSGAGDLWIATREGDGFRNAAAARRRQHTGRGVPSDAVARRPHLVLHPT